jgi:hypothetical protein
MEFDPTVSVRGEARLIEAQALVVDILGALLRAPVEATDGAIQNALARLATFTGVDRAYVFRCTGELMSNTHEWVGDGVAPMIDQLQAVPVAMIDLWRSKLEAGEGVHVADVAALPADAPIRGHLLMQDIRTVLNVPMVHDGQLFGLVGYDSVRARVILPVPRYCCYGLSPTVSPHFCCAATRPGPRRRRASRWQIPVTGCAPHWTPCRTLFSNWIRTAGSWMFILRFRKSCLVRQTSFWGARWRTFSRPV